LLYEWNDLASARDHLTRGLERAELGGDVRALIAGYVNAARLSLAEGDLDAAAETLERARSLVEQAPFLEWTSRYQRCRLELWLAQGRLRAAIDWADAMLRDGVLPGRPDGDLAQLALARTLIVRGDVASRERALALLDLLLRTVEDEGRAGIQIEALALEALAHWQGGDRAGAMTALDGALRLAEPEGYVRLFADLGSPMARLLHEARSRDVMPDYVATLLAACGVGFSGSSAEAGALPEPLSRREQDVLGLIAAGLTNREIAEVLVISPETVKKHAASIYGKLGVQGRRAAVAKARALTLFG
jgi:LuxR family transcriptional regulator, maltose regulon positive regulatory protein